MIYFNSICRILTRYLLTAIVLGTLWGGPLVILLVIEWR
jgi:hypothetical protein